jgi:hypothetical protein
VVGENEAFRLNSRCARAGFFVRRNGHFKQLRPWAFGFHLNFKALKLRAKQITISGQVRRDELHVDAFRLEGGVKRGVTSGISSGRLSSRWFQSEFETG